MPCNIVGVRPQSEVRGSSSLADENFGNPNTATPPTTAAYLRKALRNID
jgi:hypothetical protein